MSAKRSVDCLEESQPHQEVVSQLTSIRDSCPSKRRKKERWTFKPFIRDVLPDSDSTLCLRCQRIDFEAIFRIQNPSGDGVPVFDLGSINDARSTTCNFCIILTQKARILQQRKHHSQSPWHLRVYSPLVILGLAQSISNQGQISSVVLTIYPTKPRKTQDMWCQQDSFDSHVIVPLTMTEGWESKSKNPIQGEILSRYHVNHQFLRSAIHNCVQKHGCFGQTQSHSTIDLRVIDCTNRAIVPLPPGKAYICLSYVWGQDLPTHEESRSLNKSMTLPPTLPKTIEDALSAVLNLGEVYLWVDRYCIDQYHSEVKKQQIASMASIYEDALVTIVALGDSSSYGLPGVSTRSRNAQLGFKAARAEYIATSPNLHTCLESSAWSRRGWTYQEALLSTRCLFFTDYQVFYVCRKGTIPEEIPGWGKIVPKTDRLPNWNKSRLNPKMLEKSPYTSRKSPSTLAKPLFESQLYFYKSRELSYDTDMLDAFRGILSTSFNRSFWGIPIYHSAGVLDKRRFAPPVLRESFVPGLMWSQGAYASGLSKDADLARQKGRIKDLPSWSWASVRSRISFPRLDIQLQRNRQDLCCDFFMIKFFAEIWISEPNQPLTQFHRFAERHEANTLPESTKFLHIRSYAIDICPHGCSGGDHTYQQVLKSEELKTIDSMRLFNFGDKGPNGVRTTINWDWEAVEDRKDIKSDRKRFGAVLMISHSHIFDSFDDGDMLFINKDDSGFMLEWLAIIWDDEIARRVGLIEMVSPRGVGLLRKALKKTTITLA